MKKLSNFKRIKVVGKVRHTERPIVHGYMIYACDSCSEFYEMYLEKGLEDPVQDAINPKMHKPVPFVIQCPCGGQLQHINWGQGDSDKYEPLPDGANYFKNDQRYDCGVPIVRRADGCLCTDDLRGENADET